MKKRIAFMLAALMCVNTMAACGTGTATDTTDTPQKEEQKTTEKQPEQETVGDDVTVNICMMEMKRSCRRLRMK